MCGIAGYSLSRRSGVGRTLAAQALLAGIADRGADAVGYASLAAHSRNEPRALEALAGAMAAAWFDQREPGTVFAARGIGRPLWLGRGRDEVFFASNRAALEVASEYAGVTRRLSEVRDGTFLALRDGRVARTARFRPDRDYVEDKVLPTVRAPGESAHCIAMLAAIAAGAAA